MTRINIIPVHLLSNEHLRGEYKEITRPFNKVIKRVAAATMGRVCIPENYILGAGHETFFFDKLAFIHRRYKDLFEEMARRGFNVNENNFNTIYDSFWTSLADTPYWNDYHPAPKDIYLNMARLVKRSNMENVLLELKENN